MEVEMNEENKDFEFLWVYFKENGFASNNELNLNRNAVMLLTGLGNDENLMVFLVPMILII